jgi:NADH dehydrogenase
MWIFEGVNKIGEGWFSWAQGSKSGWMFSEGVVQAGVESAAEAESAAGAAEDLFGATEDLFGSATDLFGSAETAVTDTLSAASAAGEAAGNAGTVWDFTKPILDQQGVIATWFRTTFMDNIMALIPFQAFQLMIVLVEMGIGLAMIGGLFTWWAAVISIVMCFVFTVSGLFAWNQVWFIFAGFLLLGGAGRAFGLDCWIVPLVKKWWNGTRFARKHYFYLDGPSK